MANSDETLYDPAPDLVIENSTHQIWSWAGLITNTSFNQLAVLYLSNVSYG